jgi:hypothetical protein
VISRREEDDDEGYLTPEVRVGIPEADPPHANLDSGELIARDVLEIAKSRAR